MGQITPGSTILQIGSGIQIMTVVDRIVPRIQPFYNSFRGVGGTAYLMAALQNGGTVFEWARRILGASWTEMYQGAFESGEGNGGIVFLPYAAGERAPLLDPAATAVWAYMKLGCTRNQIIRSVFEGVALAVRDSWDALTSEGITAPSMLLTGGGSADPRWRQMLADILQVPLVPALDMGNATLGAGYIGGIAAGHWRCAGEVPFASRSDVIIMPQICNGLDQRLERFRATYKALKQT
jgi:xylulokinase